MVWDIGYIIVGLAAILIVRKAKEDSPNWIINIWGLIMVLTGVGFFGPFTPNHSFLPFGMLASMILFKGAHGPVQPLFFLSGIFFFIYPLVNMYGSFLANPILILIGVGLLFFAGIKMKSFNRQYIEEVKSYTPPIHLSKPSIQTARRELYEVVDSG